MGFKTCLELKTDFYDMGSGNLYHIADYCRLKDLGLPTIGVVVTDMFGNELGYIPEDKVHEIGD